MNVSGDPLVSIVITTKNESKNIENCLKSIVLQSYTNIEIIVVDNNSKDMTKEISLKYTKLVFDQGPERSAQRNFGLIEKASGQWAMFIDADMVFSPGLVKALVNLVQTNLEIDAVYIQEVILGTGFVAKVRRFESRFYDGSCIETVRFFKRSKFIEIGGFDLDLTGPEDWDFDRRIAPPANKKSLDPFAEPELNNIEWTKSFYKFLKNRGINYPDFGNVIFHNESELSVSEYLNKKKYYSNSMDKYINKWSRSDSIIQKQLGFKYRYLQVFTEDGKWIRLVKHPILSFKLYFLRGLAGLFYILKAKK